MAADHPTPDRIVATVALDLVPWVRQVAQEMDLNPNMFINAVLSSLREAVESSDQKPAMRIVDLCRRARARVHGLEGNAATRALTTFVEKLYPDLSKIEEHNKTRFWAIVSQMISDRGEIPSAEELERIQTEVGDATESFAKELRDQRRQAKRQARQQKSDE